MTKYGYKSWLGGILAGSLIAAPAAFAHGGAKYSSDMSQSYAWNDETASPSFNSENSFNSNDENPQFSNDSNPAPIRQSDQSAMNERLRRDQDRLDEDMRNGASDEQIAEDRRAIELDQQGSQDSVAFNGDGTVVVIPGS